MNNRGSSASVYLCNQKKTKQNLAVKVIEKKPLGLDPKSQKRLETEIEILKTGSRFFFFLP